MAIQQHGDLTQDGYSVDFIGPIEYHAVVVNGRRVPHLTATPLQGGRILLAVENAMSVEISLADAQYLVPFMANCLAVGMGYSSFPEPNQEPAPAVTMPQMGPVTLFG